MDRQTIDDLSSQVPSGEARLFTPSDKDRGEQRFFSVRQNWDYKPGRLTWQNEPRMEKSPWYGARESPRTSVSDISPPKAVFAGPAKKMVDFYSTGSDAFFLSDRLVALIETMDGGALDRVPVSIVCNDADLRFHLVMTARVIEAVDPSRTAVLIKDDRLGDMWFRRIRFPEGVVFQDAELATIHAFADLDARGWYWSRELIDAAKAKGIKGLRTVSPSVPEDVSVDIDRL